MADDDDEVKRGEQVAAQAMQKLKQLQSIRLAEAGLSVREVAGRGMAIVATRDFAPGVSLLREKPLVRVSKRTDGKDVSENPKATALMNRVYALAAEGTFDPSDFDSWPAEVVNCMEQVLDIQAKAAYNSLPLIKRLRWMELSDSGAGDGEKTVGGILRTNGFDDKEGCATMYELVSRVNHSCAPNAERIAGDNHEVTLVALKAIKSGEEVTVSYIDTDLPLKQRRKHLRQQYKFDCICPRCS